MLGTAAAVPGVAVAASPVEIPVPVDVEVVAAGLVAEPVPAAEVAVVEPADAAELPAVAAPELAPEPAPALPPPPAAPPAPPPWANIGPIQAALQMHAVKITGFEFMAFGVVVLAFLARMPR